MLLAKREAHLDILADAVRFLASSRRSEKYDLLTVLRRGAAKFLFPFSRFGYGYAWGHRSSS